MRRRLYFVLPDVASAKRTADDLLLARVEDRHMRFLARRGMVLDPLHEAGYLDKTDMVHGAVVGLALGGIIGALAGALVVAYPPDGMSPKLVAVLIGMLAGAPLGAWMASMAAAAVPNSRLRQFQADIEAGSVLLMVDVPFRRVAEITELVVSRHPEAVPRGEAMRYVFP
jgi:large-conductance mechanosensitive channel